MPILATCRNNRYPGAPSSRGFTLLEMMVVLVILALGAAVATPALLKLVDSMGRENNRDRVARYLQQLPVNVMRDARALTLAETGGYVPLAEALDRAAVEQLGPELDGARVWIPEPIDYRSNGACTGGSIHWELAGDYRFTLELRPPLCRPQLRT